MSKPEPDFSKGKQGFLHSLQCVLQCKVCLLLQHGKHVTQLDSQFFVDFMKGYSAVSRWFRQVNTTQKSTCVVGFYLSTLCTQADRERFHKYSRAKYCTCDTVGILFYGINNMFVESFHQVLKFVYLQHKQNRRVDFLLATLIRDKTLNLSKKKASHTHTQGVSD